MYVLTAAINVPEIFLGAATGIAIQAAYANWMRRRIDRRGRFAGVWYQEILPIDGVPRRLDTVHLSQDGPLLFGEFHRNSPPEEEDRKWSIHGYAHGNRAVFSFFTITPNQDPSSFGMIALARDSHNKRSQAWYGVYYRPDNEDFADLANGHMLARPIAWQRTPKDEVDFVLPEHRSSPAREALDSMWS